MAKKAAKRRPGRSRPKKTSAARKTAPKSSHPVAAGSPVLPGAMLVGPNLLDTDGNAISDRYLWSAILYAPYARIGDPVGQNYPIRPLVVDASTVKVKYGFYVPERRVDFCPPPSLHAVVRADPGDDMTLTVALTDAIKKGTISADGGQEIVATPIGRYDKQASDWPDQPFEAMKLPILRLADGRVRVAFTKSNPLFKLFVGLGLKPTGRGRLASITIDLTPLGFEFDTRVTLPFVMPSGRADPVAVAGRFCLTQEPIGIWDEVSPSIATQLCLRKLSDSDATRAWNDIAARLTKASSGAAQWSSIEQSVSTHTALLRWAVDLDSRQNFQIDNTLLDLSPDAFTFIFSSTAGPALRTRRPDGVALLASECLQMKFQVRSSQIDLRSFCLSQPDPMRGAPAPPGLEYSYKGQTQTETIAIVSPSLSYQPRDLAQRLRDFYEMIPFDHATATPSAMAPSWLWAFTPVERGWVQFPVPNLAPPDPDNDAERIASLPTDVGGGAFTGFARFSNRQQGAEPIPTLGGGGGNPPWSVSFDRADAFRGTWRLDARAGYLAAETHIVFDAPQMYCRGLIWISADAPGPQEALPRLSAGPGSLVDIAFDIGAPTGADVAGLVFSLDGALTLKIEGQAPAPTLSYKGISAGFPAGAGPRDLPQVPEELGSVFGVSGAPTWKDLRAIAWMRHPNIPLIAEMPMTRASSSDSGPLESRDFAPYRCETFAPNSRLFQVRHADGAFWNTLVETSGRDGRLQRLGAWPWSQVSSVAGKAARARRAAAPDPLEQIVGIAFAPIGVAGVETQPTEQLGSSWDGASFAYRYDIALLDEAFATAEPPPVAAPEPPPANQPAPLPPPPKPVATALDLAALKTFWDDQRIRHSLSRVQASYAFGWGGRTQRNVNVANLAQPYVWQTTAAFSDAADLGEVTIGPSVNGPLVNASGPKALLGLSARFKINGQYLTIADDGTISVVGWSPATYDANGLTTDMRGFAAESAPRVVGELLIRKVEVIGVNPSPSRLVSARKFYTVPLSGQESLAFWFRDLPVTKTGGRMASWVYQPSYDPSIDFDDATRNWLREQLPFAGFEWRLGRHSDNGLWHDALDFFGLYLTPLRLVQVSFSDDQGEPGPSIQSVKIVCRLDLARPPHDSVELTNLVELTLESVRGASDLLIRQISGYSATAGSSPDKQLCWALNCNISVLRKPVSRGMFGNDGPAPDKPITAYLCVTPDEKVSPGDHGIRFKSAALELPFLGTRWSIDLNPFSLPPDATDVALTPASKPKPSDVYVEAAEFELQPKETRLAVNFDLAVKAGVGEPYPLKLMGGNLYWLGAAWLSNLTTTTVAATKLDLHFDYDRAAVTLSFQDFIFGSAKPAQLFRGFPLTGFTASATLAFSVMPSAQDLPSTGPVAGLPRFAIVAAYGEVQADRNGLRLRHVIEKRENEEEAARRMRVLDTPPVGTWTEELRFSGTLAKTSWIQWPVLDVDPKDPLGSNQSPGQDRITVTFAPSGAATHDISLVFADHPVPTENLVFDQASHVVSLGQPWNAYVLAEHKITRGSDVLTWSGIQAITIEDLDGIVAEAASTAEEPTVLATRYVNQDNSRRRSPDDPYMVHPGLARRRYGLRGRHGSAFLKKILASYQVPRRRPKAPVVSSAHALVVSSSHIGMFTPQAKFPDQRRLLEMPFFADLFGIDGKALVFDQPLPTAQPSEIAWFDWPTTRAPTPTARDIVTVDPVHQIDAASLDGLLASRGTDGSAIELDGLFSVEQYFAKPDTLSADKSVEPIWLRALLALNTLWKEVQVPRVPEDPLPALAPISLVPTIAAGTDKEGNIERRYAVALLRVGAANDDGSNDTPAPVSGQLIVCDGTILRRAGLPDWIAQKLAKNVGEPPEASDRAAIAATCSALAAQPSFALLRYRDADHPGIYVVAPVTLEALRGRELFVARRPLRPPADRLYESASRGWSLPPRAAMDGLGGVWVTGVASGAIAPIRDDNADAKNADPSGVAGVATRFTAIAYSAEPAKDDDAGADVLWFADRSAPAFRAPTAAKEPISARAADAPPLATPPIDWLTPHPPRARVPTPLAIRAIVGEVRVDRRHDSAGPLAGLAPMLPSRFGEAVVGERAGVVYARRTSLIAREADAYVLDEREPRFGAAGAHGSSIVRQVRTPRPGPIPPNVGDRGRDRRTFVWDGEYSRLCRLVRGSVNVVRSDKDDQPWIISIGAETATNGVISDIWNGRATLTFEIIWRIPDGGTHPPYQPDNFVWNYLLTRNIGKTQKVSVAARLTVGARTFVYTSIAPVTGSGWNSAGGLLYGLCSFAIDPDARRLADVQSALAVLAPGAPAVISLTVENDAVDSSKDLTATWPPTWPQSLANDPADGMKSGARRPAVTLDLPLAVVSRSRLALPLVPATLVFADPAYDAVATTTAFQTRRTFSSQKDGPVTIALAADREPYYASESVGFMFDARKEKRENGKWEPVDLSKVSFDVTLRRIPRGGKPAVKLKFGDTSEDRAGSIAAGRAYSFAIGALRDDKGQPVVFEWGDLLEIAVAIDSQTAPSPGIIDFLRTTAHPPLQLRIVEKPTLAPPESLYAVLARTPASAGGGYRVEAPLVAQSPRTDRLDFVDLVEDLRDGLVRRRAQWLWRIARPVAELIAGKADSSLLEVYLVKADRNGQMQLPDRMEDFTGPETFGSWPPTSSKRTGHPVASPQGKARSRRKTAAIKP